MTRDVWAIVPVKRFADAKQRLSPRFSPAARARLAAAMLEDVISALARTEGLAGTVLVTAEEGARSIADRYGAELLHRARDDGVNPAVRQGLDQLTERRALGALIVPGDLAFVVPDELSEAAAAIGSRSAVVIAPAGRDGGTNLLGLELPTAFALAFGEKSFTAHLHNAHACQIEPFITRSIGLAVDVDLPRDLELDARMPLARYTAKVLGTLAE